MSTPGIVTNYLKTIEIPHRCYAYLKLDKQCRVVASGGKLHHCGIRTLDSAVRVDAQINMLLGLLPVTGDGLVINNVQPENDLYIDMHLFVGQEFQWVVFVNNTEAGIGLQAEQQIRLSDEIAKECKE